jgi:hypothetical protein
MSGGLSWSVRIVPTAGGEAAFQPWGVDANPGDPVKAQVGDIVTWGNAAGGTHQPWPTVGNTPNGAPVASNPPGSPLFFSEPIGPDGSSTPQYVVPTALPATTPGGASTPLTPGSVICYCCRNHNTERGQIVIF